MATPGEAENPYRQEARFEEEFASQPRSSLKPGTLKALWRSVTAIDRGKVNKPAIALRNALAVSIPLAIGFAIGHPAGGAAFATGALNVAYSDGTDPYAHRARRMLAWSVLGAIAVFSGSVSGTYPLFAVALAAGWAFLAGLLVSISQRAGDLGLNTLVALIVFSARGPGSPAGALDAALLVLGGGLLQTLFALLLWPVHRYRPEREAIGGVYADLAEAFESSEENALAEPLSSTPASEVQDTLAALGRDRSLDGERFRVLLDQADRIRLSAFLLRRLQSQLAYQAMNQIADASRNSDSLVAGVDRILEDASRLLRGLSKNLLSANLDPLPEHLIERVNNVVFQSRSLPASTDPLSDEILSALDIFAGQVRAALRLVGRSTSQGQIEFQRREDALSLHLQIRSWLDTMLANLTFRSASFRHGIRMAVFVTLGEIFSRGMNWQRSYWIPMTVAVVLKPGFTTTFSRGALRVAGTLVGLLLATGLCHVLPVSALPELLLVTAFTFAMRMFGPANYGLFSIAITGLIVFLIAAVGVPPGEVVMQRGLNTFAGGCLALIAYAVWPTWERRLVREVMAEMLDTTRLYFQAVIAELSQRRSPAAQDASNESRQSWRRARSNAEASVERVSSEPRFTAEKLSALNSMLASSHFLVQAIIGLEAGVQASIDLKNVKELQAFAHGVEFTLYFLAAALRGSPGAHNTLPKLREDHRRLFEASAAKDLSGDLVLLETDRMVVALNTLREQTLRFVS